MRDARGELDEWVYLLLEWEIYAYAHDFASPARSTPSLAACINLVRHR